MYLAYIYVLQFLTHSEFQQTCYTSILCGSSMTAHTHTHTETHTREGMCVYEVVFENCLISVYPFLPTGIVTFTQPSLGIYGNSG